MAYFITKPNFPTYKKQGTYPSGSLAELGLNSDNLEKTSLGSWEDLSLSNNRFLLGGIDTYNVNPESVIKDNPENFQKENLFGFVYINNPLDEGVRITQSEIQNKLKLLNYDKKTNLDNYKKSSFPVKIDFGIDFLPTETLLVANYNQQRLLSGDIGNAGDIKLEDTEPLSTDIKNQENEELSNGNLEFFPNNTLPDNEVYRVWLDDWSVGYLNKKNPGDPVPIEIEPIVLNKNTPFKIKWNIFGKPESWGNLGSRRYSIPNGAYRIEFDPPLDKENYPIKILDRVKLFSYWDHEYNVTDIIGTLDTIESISLDVLYANDIDADALAIANTTLGFIAGKDWLPANAAQNKVAYLPSPFQLRGNAGQNQEQFESIGSNLADAYTWGNQYDKVEDRAASQYGGIPVLRSEDMPDDYEIIIRRPKSTEAENGVGFTKLEFENGDIKTTDGDDELSLFAKEIPHSPRQLSVDIPPALEEKSYPYSDGGAVNANELIGFRGGDDNGYWENGLAKADGNRVYNSTMRTRHGYFANDTNNPPSDVNNSGNGKEQSGLLTDDNTIKFFLLGSQATLDDSTTSDRKGYPTVIWSKDSEFVLYPNINTNDELELEPDKYYRLSFIIRIKRKFIGSYTNSSYKIKLGVGILDTSQDENNNGNVYDIKSLQSTHDETILDPLDDNEWVQLQISSKFFTNIESATNLKGIPYITVNSSQDAPALGASSLYNQSRAGNNFTGLSEDQQRFYLQIQEYQFANVEITNTDTSNFLDITNSSLYKYKVLQWGDEKQQLTNDDLLNSFYLNWYNTETPSEWVVKQYYNEATKTENFIKTYDKNTAKGYFNLTSHVYTKPGIKSIKAIVYRVNQDEDEISETKILTTNILINNSLLLTQDFSIFGGANFNFLPIVDNQAIIGGFDVDSKYHNSVSKIVKDDNFIDKDYLERVSARDYIEKINNNFLGKRPGQLDLGQTRVFTEPKDIYDFIGADKLEWINQGSGSLPVNSLATDIFIRDDKCVVDLNSSNTEYSAIQNQAGSEEIGILIGDYKINQSEGSSVQKQGVMETPLLETDNEKQAF